MNLFGLPINEWYRMDHVTFNRKIRNLGVSLPQVHRLVLLRKKFRSNRKKRIALAVSKKQQFRLNWVSKYKTRPWIKKPKRSLTSSWARHPPWQRPGGS